MYRTVSVCLLALIYFATLCYSNVVKSAVDSWEFHRPELIFYPPEIRGLIQGERKRIYFSIIESNDTEPIDDGAGEIPLGVALFVRAEKPDVVDISENATSLLCLKSGEAAVNHSFEIKGVLLGYSNVHVDLYAFVGNCLDADFQNYRSPENWYQHRNSKNGSSLVTYSYDEYVVSVVPAYSVLADIFTGVMALIVAINFVNMGCQLDLPSILEVLKKPVGPVIGFICQFAFMPLASYGIGYLMFDDINLRLGLFTLGCSPGGSMSNFWTLLFDGDINLSVTMTFISTVAALGMMPLWIFTLGRHLFRDGKITLPYLNLMGSLVMLTLPVAIGMLIKRYRNNWASISQKFIRPFTILCIIFGLTVGLYANRYVLVLFTWKIVAAGIIVAWLGYLFGALAAFIFRLSKKQIVAISIETAFQNGPVAFVMLLLSLPQPDAFLTAVPVVAQLILTGIPMWTIFTTVKIVNCIKNCQTSDREKKMLSGETDLGKLTKV